MLKARYGLYGAHWRVRVFVDGALSGTLSFRAGEEEAAMWTILRTMPHEEESGPKQASTGVVLIVDDDQSVAESTARVVRPHFSQTWICGSLDEVRDAVKRMMEDGVILNAVVTDYQLPDGTGRDVLETVARVWGDTPHRVLISGCPRGRECPVDLGLYDKFLLKPFRSRDLVSALGQKCDVADG